MAHLVKTGVAQPLIRDSKMASLQEGDVDLSWGIHLSYSTTGHPDLDFLLVLIDLGSSAEDCRV